MSDVEIEQMYREVILDHYKSPRGHGLIEGADVQAEGQNPLCGDEVTISVKFADGRRDDRGDRLRGRGCAISQAATSMLTELVQGRSATEVAVAAEGRAARGDRDPADADPPQVRDPRARRAEGRAEQGQGHAAARGVAGPDRRSHLRVEMPKLDVAPLAEFGPGSVKIVTLGWTSIGVYNCNGELLALEDRCSHDDGPLCEGEWDEETCRVICPRHGSTFDLRTGRPAHACRRSSRSRPIRSRSRTASCWWRSTRAEALLGDDRPALQRLPRRGVGPPGHDRAGRLRAPLPRGLPVGALVAHDPAEAGGVPGRVRGIRPGCASPASTSATSSGCSATPRSSVTAGKIEATIANARATVELRAAGTPAGRALLVARPGVARAVAFPRRMPATTPESAALSKSLRRAGFRFVGPTTAYAAMQACGVVNDHVADCWVRDSVEAARKAWHPS